MPLFDALPDGTSGPSDMADSDSLNPEPFTRKVTSLLMRSLARITAAVDADEFNSLTVARQDQPLLSANLCEGLLRMKPVGDTSRPSVSAAWSKTLPPQDIAPPPASVVLRAEHFRAVAELVPLLRPVRKPKLSVFIGLVDALFGEPDQSGLVSGEARLSIYNQEENRLARVVLGPDDYKKAWKAHGVGGYVQLQGVLIPGDRVDRIERIKSFRLLKD